MKKKKEIGLDFIVDKLTNSIENIITGDNFATDISLLTNSDLKSVSKTNGWVFNWKAEFKEPIRDVYKMKGKKIELDVDFIGGEGVLTDVEEKALSDFFKQRKLTSKTKVNKKLKAVKQPKQQSEILREFITQHSPNA